MGIWIQRETTLALSVIVALSVLTASCGESQDADLQQWKLPLDEYRNADTANNEWAENVLTAECMAAKGLEYRFVEPRDFGAVWNDEGRRLFDEDVAEEYGYHTDPPHYAAIESSEWNSRLAAEDPRWTESYDSCFAEVRAELPVPDKLMYADLMGADAYRMALEDEAVLAAAEEWRSCFSDETSISVSVDPDEMPTIELAEEFSLYDDEIAPSPITDREREVAGADARCRASTGYTKELYEAEVGFQRDFMEERASELVEVRRVVQAYEGRAEDVLHDRGLI